MKFVLIDFLLSLLVIVVSAEETIGWSYLNSGVSSHCTSLGFVNYPPPLVASCRSSVAEKTGARITRNLVVGSSKAPVPSSPVSLSSWAHGCCSSSSSNNKNSRSRIQRETSLKMSFSSSNDGGESLMDTMSAAVAKSLKRDQVKLEPTRGGGVGGGGGASVAAAVDKVSGDKYFIKTAPAARAGSMLRAEYAGVKEMSDTDTIRVPRPVAYGEGGPTNTAFVVFEYLDMCGGGSAYELGVQLAKMHKCFSPDNKGFGFHVDNTIGATPQPNLPWIQDWAEFWDTHRLGRMLKLTQNVGFGDKEIQKLREKTRELLSHNPKPSLLHGDLWGGNKGYAKIDGKATPVIFDPATYYGDREADIAMTYLFGGFSSDFYNGYESEWPLPSGHQERRTVYNLYHILNHYVLFGGGYRGQARGMINQILRY